MKKYAYFAFFLFSADAFVRIINFVTNAYIARVLDTTSFGMIAISTSFLTAAMLLGDCGLKTLGFIETSTPPHARTFSIEDIFATKIVLACISFILLSISTYTIFKDNKLQIICLIYLLNIFYEGLFLEWYFRGLQKFGVISILSSFSSLTYCAAVFLFVKNSSDIFRIPLLYFITNIASALVLIFFASSTTFRFSFSFSPKKQLPILKNSFVIGTSTLLNQVTVYLPPMILGSFVGIRDAGVFGAALKIVIVALIIDRVFLTIFLSTLPRIWAEDKDTATRYLQMILRITVVVGFSISLLVNILSETMVSLIFGDSYLESGAVLANISWFIVLTMVNSIFAYGLLAIGEKKRYLFATAVGFGINTLLISGLCWLYKTTGTCIAMVTGELVFTILCYYQFQHYCRLKFFAPLLSTAIISAIIVYISSLLHINALIKAPGAAAVLIILSILCNIIPEADRELLQKKWKHSI